MIQERMVSDTETPSNMKMKGVFKDGSQISGHRTNIAGTRHHPPNSRPRRRHDGC